MRVVNHLLTSGENLSHQKRVPQTKFTSADYVVFITALQWDDVTKTVASISSLGIGTMTKARLLGDENSGFQPHAL